MRRSPVPPSNAHSYALAASYPTRRATPHTDWAVPIEDEEHRWRGSPDLPMQSRKQYLKCLRGLHWEHTVPERGELLPHGEFMA